MHLQQNALSIQVLHIQYSAIITLMLSLLFDVGMATAPITGYIMQYRLILLNKSVGAFSIDICLVLLFANIMRLNFYIFRQYETALVFQSLFMIAAQILLLKICTLYQEKPQKQASEMGLTNIEAQREEEEDFWRWSNFSIYVKYIVVFWIGTFLLSMMMKVIDVGIYGDLIGLVALMSQSLLILPQIIQIFKQGRVGGISYLLIFLNLLGDIIKMYYFVVKDQPFQFKLCGAIQLFLDSFVILQIWYYQSREEGLTEIEEETIQGQNRPAKSKQIQNDNLDGKDLQGSISQTVVLENLQELDQVDSESTRNNES